MEGFELAATITAACILAIGVLVGTAIEITRMLEQWRDRRRVRETQ